MSALLALPLLAVASTATTLPSTPDLGQAAGRCRAHESGPAFEVTVAGLKDRAGDLRLEVYPANNTDFLADDNKLVAAGKTFRRVVMKTPATGPVHMCVRVPGPGTYAISLLHDRNSDRKFQWRRDGIGFASNPRLGWSKPKADKASAHAGPGLTPITIVMNYARGLGMSPLSNNKG